MSSTNTLRVFIDPTFTRADNADGGIRRVTEAQHRYLPEFGVQPVMSPDEAELIANHGAALTERPGVPSVAHCHGLYWSRYAWPAWAHEVNAQVVETLAHAQAVTAPSRWVAQAMTRGMLVYPEVIYHGVDAADWTPEDTQGYVLWNKARTDFVSDPTDLDRVARLLPDVRFVSTFGQPAGNVVLTGPLALSRMKPLVQHAGVYLATARETFGIGTLEALACGVPVAGWRWGGQAEIIIEGETGYLAEPGDDRALAECVRRCLAERERLGANARADSLARWGWRDRIAQYAALYLRVADEWYTPRPKVTVIVTCYNLDQYLPEALDSVLDQTMQDWECLIVDDCSHDHTPAIAHDYEDMDARFHYVRTPENLKLPGALNYGAERARGRYLLPLDADNLLAPDALAALAAALDADPGIHIAYGHLDILEAGGQRHVERAWPPPEFEWRAQLGHLNQIPSTAMLRREVWQRSGGWRRRQWRAEDAEFWCRVTSLGFRARKVTEAATFTYRNRSDSKSKGEPGDGNWTAWFPWGWASSGPEGAALYRAGKGPVLERVPWSAQGRPPAAKRFWDVPDCTQPLVSVIIPVGPGHRRYLLDALDSLVAQTLPDWEAIVIFDDGAAPERIAGAPYARIYATNAPKSGPGVARNLGARHARGQVLYFLDADDYILPWTIEKLVAAWRATVRPEEGYPGNIVCSGWLRNDEEGDHQLYVYEPHPWECARVERDASGRAEFYGVLRHMLHSVNVLIPRSVHVRIGGFDESMTGWEDWDYFIAAQAVAGECSTHLDEPLFVYRFRAGTRRESSFGDGVALKAYLRQKWSDYYDGRKQIVCGCRTPQLPSAPSTPGTPSAPAKALASEGTALAGIEGLLAGTTVKLVYQGVHEGPLNYRGQFSQKVYRYGKDEDLVWHWMPAEDAAPLLMRRRPDGQPEFYVDSTDAPARAAPVAPPLPSTAEVVQAPVASTPPARPEWPVMETPEALPVVPQEPFDHQDGPPIMLIGRTQADIRALIADAAKRGDQVTLLRWRDEEQTQAAPRKAVLRELNRALSQIEVTT